MKGMTNEVTGGRSAMVFRGEVDESAHREQAARSYGVLDEQLVGGMQPDVALLDPDDPALPRPRRVK